MPPLSTPPESFADTEPAVPEGAASGVLMGMILGAMIDLLRHLRSFPWRRAFSNPGPVATGEASFPDVRKTSSPGLDFYPRPVRDSAESASFRPVAEHSSLRRSPWMGDGIPVRRPGSPCSVPVSPDGLSDLPTPVRSPAVQQPKASTSDGKRIINPSLSPPTRQSFRRPQPQSPAEGLFTGIRLKRRKPQSAPPPWRASFSAAA